MSHFTRFRLPFACLGGITLIGISTLASFAAEDFSRLKAHWNFDEARDWHNMAFPFEEPVSLAKDYVGTNDLKMNDRFDPVNSWAAGRQFSGIRINITGQLMEAVTPLDELKKTAALSYWIKTEAQGNKKPDGCPGVIGDAGGMIWGAIGPDGHLVVTHGDEIVAASNDIVNDGEWHHVVIMRNAENGSVYIFLDGKAAGKGKTPSGELAGDYLGFGAIKGGTGFHGVLDQVHLFEKQINEDTVLALRDNHAPKAYEISTLISRKRPSITGSVLHYHTFDPDQDSLSVSRFSQGKHGEVVYNKDGTFTYTAGPGFRDEDRFEVIVTDKRGGFCSTWMIVKDESTVPQMPVTKYTDYQELPPIGEGSGKTNKRVPVVYDWNGDGKPDILVAGNGRLWFYKNTSTRQRRAFEPPVEVKDGEGKPIEARSISLLPPAGKGKAVLVVKTAHDHLLAYEAATVAKSGTKLTLKGKIKDENGDDFICKSESFAFGDFDNDGLPDLLIGEGQGGIFLHRNTGTTEEPLFETEREQIISNSYNLAPYFADLNGDGKLDLLHGINWGSIHYWINDGGGTIMEGASTGDLLLTDKSGKIPMAGDNTVLRHMNGTHGAFGDFNGDGVIDMVLGGYSTGSTCVASGTDVNTPRNNLALIERIYKDNSRNLGKALEANNQELLHRYRMLSREWIHWAVNLPSVAAREKAYQELKAHIRRFDFLKRKPLDAWVKRDKDKIIDVGPMHHVPGIFVMNWVTLHCMLPDSEKHRLDVADALGLKGLDREQYLKSGVAVADNNKCSDGQILSITDMMKYHPRVLFPDDHISIDLNMGDGREAMAYVFESNKNTFGTEVGNSACESSEDLRIAMEKCLGEGAGHGDYFTLVMAHEVCHSLDAYVNRRKNQDLARRWCDMIIYAGNNAGENEIIAQNESGWMDMEETRELFKDKNLWDGNSSWENAWKDYWDNCSYKDLTFMRGNIGWFIGAKQETLATQANHHWPNSEGRLIGAIDRYNRGYKANINEVVLYLDFLSAGLNKIPMYHVTAAQNPNRAVYHVEKAWLDRNDKGYITKITIAERRYEFDVDNEGRVIGIKSHPWSDKL